jgi:hypothetical protein
MILFFKDLPLLGFINMWSAILPDHATDLVYIWVVGDSPRHDKLGWNVLAVNSDEEEIKNAIKKQMLRI